MIEGEEILNDFNKEKEMPKEVIEKYRNLVPKEMIEIWEKYGLGSFLNGYLRVINPDDYKELVEETYFRGNVAIPIFITAFADVVTWEEDELIGMIEYKTLDVNAIWEGMDNFFELLSNKRFLEKNFELEMYNKALKLYGEVGYEDCYCFVPVIPVGGKKIENLQKGKAFTHIEVIVYLMGRVE